MNINLSVILPSPSISFFRTSSCVTPESNGGGTDSSSAQGLALTAVSFFDTGDLKCSILL